MIPSVKAPTGARLAAWVLLCVFAGVSVPRSGYSSGPQALQTKRHPVRKFTGKTERKTVRVVSEAWSRTATNAPQQQPKRAQWIGHFPGYAEAKRKANARLLPTPGAPELLGPLSQSAFTPSLTTVFDGPDESVSAGIPPDPVVAAGPNNIVAVINSTIAIYDKTGVQQGGFQDLGTFFGSLGISGPVFDSRVIYDVPDGRFILTSDETDFSTNSNVFIAVSATSDPTGLWNKFAVNTKGQGIGEATLADFPTLGLSSSAIYISTGQFGMITLSFVETDLRVIGLTELLSGSGALNITTFQNVQTATGQQAFVIQGALTYGTAPSEFLIAASFATPSPSTLNLFSVTTLGTPMLSASNLTVPTFTVPPDAPQPGTAVPIATNDFRMHGAVWMNNSLWCAQTVGDATGAAAVVRWYEIGLTDVATASVVESGTVAGSGNAFFPAVGVKPNGDAVLAFTSSSEEEFASAAFTGRSASDPLGAMRFPSVYKPGTDSYVDFAPRWGDYNTASLDPDGNSVWTIVEYAGSPNPHFGTSIAQIAAPPALAVSASNLNFGSVDVGATSLAQTVTITNNGTDAVTFSQVTLAGVNATDFVTNTDGCSAVTLAGGGACALSFSFAPGGGGPRNALVELQYASATGAAAFATVGLAGVGVCVAPASLSSLAPPTVPAGMGFFTLELGGSCFTSDSVARWNGSDRPTQFIGDGQVLATIQPADDASPTVAQVSSFSATSGLSNALPFTVYSPVNYVSSQVPINYVTIAGTNLNLGDDTSAEIDSPFPVQFGGGTFTNLFVSSNGMIALFGKFDQFANDQLPTGNVPLLIAPFWTDLVAFPATPQNVFWDVVGTAPNRELVVEWRNVSHFPPDPTLTVTFEVVFFEGQSNILFNYLDATFGGSLSSSDQGAMATVGMQVAPGVANQFSFDASAIADNSAILWQFPSIVVTPAGINFGDQIAGTTGTAQVVTASNITGAPIMVSGVALGGINPGSFTITADACTGTTVAASGNCTVSVAFSPVAIGNASATLSLSFNASGSPQAVNLVGRGVSQGFASPAPGSLTFPDTMRTTTSAAQTVTLTNTGTGPLGIFSITSNSAEFVASPSCPSSLPAGQSCPISVSFSPSVAGPRQGTLTIMDDGAGSPTPLTLSGNGIPFAIPGLIWKSVAAFVDPRTNTGIEGGAANLINGTLYVSHGFRGTTTNFLSVYDPVADSWKHGGPSAPSAAVPRSELAGGIANGKHYAMGGKDASFNPTNVNEEFDPATITWTTRAPMNVARIGMGAASWQNKIYVIGGRDNGFFGSGNIFGTNEVYDPSIDQWTLKTPLPTAVSDDYAMVGYNGKVYVFGGTQGIFVGVTNLVQIYNISTNLWTAGGAMPVVRAAGMAGVIGSQIAVFGGLDSNFTPIVETDLYNPATNTWMLGPDMVFPANEIAQGVTGDGTRLYAVGSGIFGASLSIVQVLEPSVQYAPTSLSFAPQVVTTSSTSQAVTFTNTGSVAMQVTGASATADFAATPACGSSVPGGGNCSINISFKPTAPGLRTGQITITSNGPVPLPKISVSGTGSDFAIGVATGSSGTETVTAGQATSYNLIVAPQYGFAESVGLVCLGAPKDATCVPNSLNVQLDGTNAQPVTINVTTTARTSAPPRTGIPPYFPFVVSLGLSLVLLARRARSRRMSWGRALTASVGLFVILALMGLAACGGGGGGGTTNGTPAGTYTLTVTGSTGSLSNSRALTLVVQ